MKTEKILKTWSIVTLCFSIIFLVSLFFTFFIPVITSAFYLDLYEEFTNDLSGDPSISYRLFFQVELYCLFVFIIVNQILMWARSIVLKKNDKLLREEIDGLKKPKIINNRKEIKFEEEPKKETVKEQEEIKETPKKEKNESKKEVKKEINVETSIVTKTVKIKSADPRKDAISKFLKNNRH